MSGSHNEPYDKALHAARIRLSLALQEYRRALATKKHFEGRERLRRQQPAQQPGVCPECKGSCRTGSGYLREDCPACNGTGQQPAQLLAKHQPCGCIVCTCADDVRCHGCGAWHCGTHPVSEIPNAVYEQPAQPASLLRPAVVASAADCQKPQLVVTRGDGVPLPDQAAALAEFKRQCLQPAQPGSGEVVPRSRYDACNRDWLEEKAAHERTRDAAAKEIDRLQSALTATRAELTQRQDRIDELRIELTAAQQDAAMWEREYRIEHGRVEQLTGELLAVQRRRQ